MSSVRTRTNWHADYLGMPLESGTAEVWRTPDGYVAVPSAALLRRIKRHPLHNPTQPGWLHIDGRYMPYSEKAPTC
jgi:Uri superfamily endonuclease